MLEHIDRFLRWSFNAVSSVHPALNGALMILAQYYALSWIKVAMVIGSVRHDAPIDPMRIYYVNPRRIERTVSWTRISTEKKAGEHPLFRRPNYRLAARVFDGDWDQVDDSVSESTIYQSFVAHFEHGVSWEKTRFYEETLAAIEGGTARWDCTSRSELDERCNYLDELYERISTENYKTQNELYESGEPNTRSHPAFRVIWDEIAVSVGRDGEFIFLDGRNRLSIVRVLGLDEIPVVILVRHVQWQRLRDRIARGELDAADLPEDLQTHPDLIDLF